MSSEGLLNHLLRDENVLGSCLDGGYEFIVTNKRVLKYKQKGSVFSTEVLHDLSYREITSLTLMKTGWSLKAAIIGTILIIIGLSSEDLRLLLLFGILALIYSYLQQKNYFQFKGPGLLASTSELEIWRINTVKATDVQSFVRIVRDNLI